MCRSIESARRSQLQSRHEAAHAAHEILILDAKPINGLLFERDCNRRGCFQKRAQKCR
jgi:hypothetical protein